MFEGNSGVSEVTVPCVSEGTGGERMSSVETGMHDRLFDLVAEMLGDGVSARDIRETVRDAIHEWKIDAGTRKYLAAPDKGGG